MAYDSRTNRMRRQEAVGMDELVRQFIREMKLTSGLNNQRVAEAWNNASGASRYTMNVNLAAGTLYCSISSSIVRNQLYFQREALVARMNDLLRQDEMFIWNWEQKGDCIKTLVLK